MTTIKATYTTSQTSKVFEVPNTSSLVDSIQTIQNDINKYLTQIMEQEKKLGIKHPEPKQDNEDDDEEMEENEMDVDQEEEEKTNEKDEAQALKKQKIEA